MFRILQFINPKEEYITIKIPPALRGKLLEIVLSEKAPDDDTILNSDESAMMESKKKELIMLDQLRNQLKGWDM